MGKHSPEVSNGEKRTRHVQVVFARKMQERRVFMEELREVRFQKQKQILNVIRDTIGPRWYQTLSVRQRSALDKLESSIYQDLLEGTPARTEGIMHDLGLQPRPKGPELMHCAFVGKDDPKLMLAQLFWLKYEEPFDEKFHSYGLNAKLILSAIFYLGLDELISLLREKFKPDVEETPPKPKPKRKIEPPLDSPYQQKMVAKLYFPQPPKRKPPPPLPNLDSLNEPWEEKPPRPKKEVPPPPPPPPKKTLPISYCEKLAGIVRIEPMSPESSLPPVVKRPATHAAHRKAKPSKLFSASVTSAKAFGLSSTITKRKQKKRKPVAPKTGLVNSNYLINGIYTINGKTVYVIGNVSVIPPNGEIIHGGHRDVNGEFINIHCGIRANPPSPPPEPCDCVKRWHDSVISYLKSSKCYCNHKYDFRNEGKFPPEELQFFQKPSRNAPFSFNYATIYELEPKHLFVTKEFKKAWDTDSVIGDPALRQTLKKKRKKKPSTTCLGQTPEPEDYLKCALRYLRKFNIAAMLPDVHLTPELKVWMRRRLYGPYTRHQKNELLKKSGVFWTILKSIESKSYGHVNPPNDPHFRGHKTWAYKSHLYTEFRRFYHRYKIAMFRSQANLNNMLWATMFPNEFPDKSFRRTYFSYLVQRVENLQILHPYSSKEANERSVLFSTNRYCCPPRGAEVNQYLM